MPSSSRQGTCSVDRLGSIRHPAGHKIQCLQLRQVAGEIYCLGGSVSVASHARSTSLLEVSEMLIDHERRETIARSACKSKARLEVREFKAGSEWVRLSFCGWGWLMQMVGRDCVNPPPYSSELHLAFQSLDPSSCLCGSCMQDRQMWEKGGGGGGEEGGGLYSRFEAIMAAWKRAGTRPPALNLGQTRGCAFSKDGDGGEGPFP